MDYKLLLLTRDNQYYRTLLASCHLPGLTLLGDDPQGIVDADIWLADPALAAPLIGHAKQIKWLQATYGEVGPLIAPRLRRNYQLTCIRGIFGPPMSEYLFGHLLARQEPTSQQGETPWRPGSFKALREQRLLLLGTGNIAKHLARTAKQFGMHVTGINRSAKPTMGFDRVDTLTNLYLHIAKADAIAAILPGTPQTRRALNKHLLALMKPDAILFNLGSAEVLDLDALRTQLVQFPRQQAILNAPHQESQSLDHPLYALENVTLMPPIAAPNIAEQIVEIFTDNYHKFIRGHALQHKVNFERDY